MNILYLLFIILSFFFWLIFVELLKPRYLILLSIGIIAVSLTQTYIFSPYKVPTTSMAPTLLAGDHIIVSKSYYRWHSPRPGDVILFELPNNPKQIFIKRIIGRSGDKIEIRGKRLYINDNAVNETYSITEDPQTIPQEAQPRDFFGPVIIPEDHFFMLGDNRDFSSDSRFWGFLPIHGVKGKVSNIYWSWDDKNRRIRWKRIGKPIS